MDRETHEVDPFSRTAGGTGPAILGPLKHERTRRSTRSGVQIIPILVLDLETRADKREARELHRVFA